MDATTARHFLTDALQSSVALADGSGTVQTEYTYDPFGGVSSSGSSTTNPYAFTAREADATGLQYSRLRYYHPRLQRFASEDPLRLLGGINVFAYVGNVPTRFVDPLGMKPTKPTTGPGDGSGSGNGPAGPPPLEARRSTASPTGRYGAATMTGRERLTRIGCVRRRIGGRSRSGRRSIKTRRTGIGAP